MPAYRAMPETGKNFPVVLVVQEIFGVHEHLKDVCRRFAKLGYLAISPELYARQGDVSKLAGTDEILRKVVSQVPDGQVMADLDAAADSVAKTGKADATRLGITGFCWGGRIVWLYAAHNPHLKAGVAWYGRLVGDRSELQPRYPIDIAGSLKAPVLGLYGGRDQGIPQESIERMRAALKWPTAVRRSLFIPDAPHYFHADYRPSYAKDAAQDGFKRLQAWFKRFGAA